MGSRYINERLSYARCNVLWKERKHVLLNSKGDWGIRLMNDTYLVRSAKKDWNGKGRPVWQVVWTTMTPLVTFYPCGVIELPLNYQTGERRMWAYRQNRYALKGCDAAVWYTTYSPHAYLSYWGFPPTAHDCYGSRVRYLSPWLEESEMCAGRYVVRFRWEGNVPIPVGHPAEEARVAAGVPRQRFVIRCDREGRLMHVEYDSRSSQPCVVVVQSSGERFLPRLVKRGLDWRTRSIFEQDDLLEEAEEEYEDAQEAAALKLLLRELRTSTSWRAFSGRAQQLWEAARGQAKKEYPDAFPRRSKERRLRVC